MSKVFRYIYRRIVVIFTHNGGLGDSFVHTIATDAFIHGKKKSK